MVRRSLRAPWRWALLAGIIAACATGDIGDGLSEAQGNAGTSARQRPGLTDLLTDLSDDGSLLAGLSQGDPALRRVAARGLARLPVPAQLKQVVARANVESDPGVLAELCFAFGRWEAGEAVASLRKLAGHPASSVRAAAVAALGRLRDDRETGLIVSALEDSNPAVRQAAALALANLDGRRFKHPRRAGEDVLARRDRALAQALAEDHDRGVRWRATYALAMVRPRAGLVAPLEQTLAGANGEAVVLAFALRGLAALQAAGLTDATPAARRLLGHGDQRVVIEALALLGAHGSYRELGLLALGHGTPVIRSLAWTSLPGARARERARRAADSGAPQWPTELAQLDRSLQDRVGLEPEHPVRRAALAALAGMDAALAETLGEDWRQAVPEGSRLPEIERRRSGLALMAVQQLARSDEPRDRARAGELMAAGIAQDGDLIIALLDDDDARVQAAVLPLLGEERFETLRPRLADSLKSGDPALMGQAAKAAAPVVAAGRAPPWLVSGLAEALASCQDFVLEETRIELAAALGLPPLDPLPPPAGSATPLLQRLAERQLAAATDPSPLMRVETDRGVLMLRLDRTLAPVHVASFVELAEAGFYDGLDFHRVVPNFVVQGLDPRGDGWGVGGRRVPDEQSPQPYLTGTVGMPAAGQPHTGGCQMFITLLPTPHLDGNYTVFGQVVEGMEVVQSLLVGDKVLSVRRVDEG